MLDWFRTQPGAFLSCREEPMPRLEAVPGPLTGVCRAAAGVTTRLHERRARGGGDEGGPAVWAERA